MSTNVTYECLRCGGPMSEEMLAFRGGEIKCIFCGYRVLRKTKPPVVKRVKSE